MAREHVQHNGHSMVPYNVPTPTRIGIRDSANDKTPVPVNALEDLMRRRGVDEAWTALENMQKKGVACDKYTISRLLMRSFGEHTNRFDTSRIYLGIALVERFIEMQPADVDEVLFNALLDTCSRLKDLNRLEKTVERMRELGVSPSPVTLGILVKTYGQAGDVEKVLQVWDEMANQRVRANAVTYGCMIDACVKCRRLEKAIEIFASMRSEGKHRNTILYTTLIKGYGLEKDLQSALALFDEMPREGVIRNTITYNSIIDCCVKCGDLTAAESLLRDLTAPDSPIQPDLITFSTLLKGYCQFGCLDKALQVAEVINARGFRCDEMVYNTLMDGCMKVNDIATGIGLFEEMVESGMRPSSITHNIVARLYKRAGLDKDASEAAWEQVLQRASQSSSFEDSSTSDHFVGKNGSKNRGPRSQKVSGNSGHDSPAQAQSRSRRTLCRNQSDSSWSDASDCLSCFSTTMASGCHMNVEGMPRFNSQALYSTWSGNPCLSPTCVDHTCSIVATVPVVPQIGCSISSVAIPRQDQPMNSLPPWAVVPQLNGAQGSEVRFNGPSQLQEFAHRTPSNLTPNPI